MYDLAGLVLLAFTISIARETIIETFEDTYRHRRELIAARTRARKLEKRKRQEERKERREKEGLSLGPTLTLGYTGSIGVSKFGSDRGADQRQMEYEDEVASGVSPIKAKMNALLRRLGWSKASQSSFSTSLMPSGLQMERSLTAVSMVQEQTYASFRKEMQTEQRREFEVKIGTALALFWTFWLVSRNLCLKLRYSVLTPVCQVVWCHHLSCDGK